jgi:hypothetical protein
MRIRAGADIKAAEPMNAKGCGNIHSLGKNMGLQQRSLHRLKLYTELQNALTERLPFNLQRSTLMPILVAL